MPIDFMNNEIKNSWSLVAFSQTFDKVKLATLKNKESGQEFKALACIKGGEVTFVGFSKKMGELTSSEIQSKKNNLQVIQCLGEDKIIRYYLSERGENSWEELSL